MRSPGMEKRHFDSWQAAVNWMADNHGERSIEEVRVTSVGDQMEDAELRHGIESLDWIRTDDPVTHYYIREWDDDEVFWELRHRIDTEGIQRSWRGWVRNYYDFDGYRYWHMGETPAKIVNREPVEDSEATLYDPE